MKSKNNLFIRILSILSIFVLLFNMMPMFSNAAGHDPNDEDYDYQLRFWEDEQPDIGFYINAASRYTLETVTEPSMGTSSGEWSVMNLLSGMYTGYDYINDIEDDYFADYLVRIENFVEDRNGELDRNKSSEWSRLILALSALDYDIKDVAGYDFIERLSGSHSFSHRQGINGPIWEIIAMNTGEYEFYPDENNDDVNTYGKMLDYILEREITQPDGTVGGWSLGFPTPDADITGMVLQAFAPYYNDQELYEQTDAEVSYEDFVAAVERGVALLAEIQSANGAFEAFNNVNVESTVQAIVALTALGIDPLSDNVELESIDKNVSFITDGIVRDGVYSDNMIDALLAFWADGSGSEPGVGGFKHVTSGNDGGESGYGVDAMATDQALYGLIAYDRFLKGENPLYDMTDMMTVHGGIPYTEYEAQKLNVTFIGDNETEKQEEEHSPYAIVEIPEGNSAEGKEFVSWNSEKDGSGTVYHPGEKLSMPEHDITLYAQYENMKYSINYETNDGTFTTDNIPESYTVDDKVLLPKAEHIEKEEHEFAGWYDNEEFNDNAITEIPAGSTGNKTFFAKWESDDSEEELSVTTTLEDGLVTKSEKLTFDLWAKDENSNKISPENIEVTNNDEIVSVAWDDSEKTSYTLDLGVGDNNVKIIVNDDYILEYRIVREYAEDGDVIGTYTFSLEGFTIGVGHIVEPIQVDIIKGENAAHTLDRAIRENGFDYINTGTFENAFYLSVLMDDENTIYKNEPSVPKVLKDELGGMLHMSYIPGELGEFDISMMSGWMYSINNIFANVGFSDSYLNDGDVMRVQFTLALGNDINGNQATRYFDIANKNELTKKLAEINSSGSKDEYLSIATQKKAYDQAVESIQKLNASQEEIDEAHENILTAEQQVKEDLEAATAVIDEISVLPAIDELTLDDKEAVEAVRSSYDSLSDGQKELVENNDILIALEERVQELEVERDQEAAETVEEQIDLLPALQELTLDDKKAVEAARSSYDALSDDQKELVENVEVLNALEEKLNKLETEQNQKAVKALEDKIDSLPSVEDITLEDRITVRQANTAFNQLSEEQQNAVSNYEKLEAAKLKIEELSQASGYLPIQDAENMIDDLPNAENISLEHKKEIEDARLVFDTLTNGQQNQVVNENKLQELEAKINELQEIYNKEKAVEVDEAIESLAEEFLREQNEEESKDESEQLQITSTNNQDATNLTPELREAVSEVRIAFYSLNPEQQQLVENVDLFESIENKLFELEDMNEDQIAANKVEMMIAGLPEPSEVSLLSDQEWVDQVNAAYSELTDAQRELVANDETQKPDQLNSSLTDIAEQLDVQASANMVTYEISNLPGIMDITLDDKGNINAARQAFNELAEEAQTLVSNEDYLIALEEELTALEAEQENKGNAQEVEEMIVSLPSVDDVTLEDKENVEAARQAFNELSEEARALVSNEYDLIALEEELAVLEVEQEDKEKAREVEEIIESLPGVDDVTLEDKDLIAEVTEAFNNLTDNQKQYVENADQLTALENRLKELENDNQTPGPQDPQVPEDPENPRDEFTPSEGEKPDDGESQALDGMNNQPGDNSRTGQSDRLPDTATNTFNYLLTGLLFVVLGTAIYLVRRKRIL